MNEKISFILLLFLQTVFVSSQNFKEIQSLDSLQIVTQSCMNLSEISVRNHIYVDEDSFKNVSSIHQPSGFFIVDDFLGQEFCDKLPNAILKNGKIVHVKHPVKCHYYNQKDTFKNYFPSIDIKDEYGIEALKEISYFKSEWLKKTNFPFFHNNNSLIIHTYSSKRSEVFVFGVDLDALDSIYFSHIVLRKGKPKVLSNYNIPLWKNTKRQLKKFKKKTTAQNLKDFSKKYISSVKLSKLTSDFIVTEFYYGGNYCPFMFSVRDKPIMRREFRKTKILNFLGDIYFPVLGQYGYVW